MRSLELNARVENTRELKQKPVKFELKKIKEHFDEGMLSIEKQYRVFDDLQDKGMESEGKTILRSQIVLAEGILDFFIHEMSKYAVYHMFINQWSSLINIIDSQYQWSYLKKLFKTRDLAMLFLNF